MLKQPASKKKAKGASSALGEHLRSRHYHNEICVVPRLSAQTVIGYNE
jgi:hypothetical protein